MAYKEHGMWEVLDVLKRIHGGEGKRAVARSTGRSRKTVKRYVDAAVELGWVPGLHEPSEALAAEVLAGLRPGPHDTGPWAVETALLPHGQKLREWLALDDSLRAGLTLTKVHELLKRNNVTVSYSGLYRYAVRRLGFKSKTATVRMADVAPGELAEVDFGRLGLVWDPEKGKLRLLHALVVTLVYSRHQYVCICEISCKGPTRFPDWGPPRMGPFSRRRRVFTCPPCWFQAFSLLLPYNSRP